MIVEALVPGHAGLIGPLWQGCEEPQRRQYPRPGPAPRNEATLGADHVSGESKSDRGDAGEGRRRIAIRDHAVLFACGVPEKAERAALQVVDDRVAILDRIEFARPLDDDTGHTDVRRKNIDGSQGEHQTQECGRPATACSASACFHHSVARHPQNRTGGASRPRGAQGPPVSSARASVCEGHALWRSCLDAGRRAAVAEGGAASATMPHRLNEMSTMSCCGDRGIVSAMARANAFHGMACDADSLERTCARQGSTTGSGSGEFDFRGGRSGCGCRVRIMARRP